MSIDLSVALSTFDDEIASIDQRLFQEFSIGLRDVSSGRNREPGLLTNDTNTVLNTLLEQEKNMPLQDVRSAANRQLVRDGIKRLLKTPNYGNSVSQIATQLADIKPANMDAMEFMLLCGLTLRLDYGWRGSKESDGSLSPPSTWAGNSAENGRQVDKQWAQSSQQSFQMSLIEARRQEIMAEMFNERPRKPGLKETLSAAFSMASGDGMSQSRHDSVLNEVLKNSGYQANGKRIGSTSDAGRL
jgi:hypothetical protein